MRKISIITSILLLTLMVGCRHDGEYWSNEENNAPPIFDDTLPIRDLVFSHSILAIEEIDNILPLGNLNPPDHTFPTDHIYFLPKESNRSIFAPADGKILEIRLDTSGSDDVVKIGVTNTMTYYLDHILLDAGLAVGDWVQAGDRLGLSGGAAAVDLGLMNKNISNGFLSAHHPPSTVYGDAPLKYYESPLRESLYDLVKPTGEPAYDQAFWGVKDGKFVFDQAGRLIGNWFREGTVGYVFADHLSFCYDFFYTNQLRIAIGKDNATQCKLFAVKGPLADSSRPENIRIGQTTAFPLYNGNIVSSGEPAQARIGLMMVEMIDDNRIKIEIFDDTTNDSRLFTSAACYYSR